MQKDSLGRFGVFERYPNLTPEYVAELERLGYTAVWTAGSPPADLSYLDGLLEATKSLVFVTGIVNIWVAGPREVAASYHRLHQAHPDRFVLGIGPGHPERHSIATRPYTALVEYLDVLDQEGVPKDHRLLAALGPRVLKLSAERTLGAHPYLVTPAHSREAREILGPDALLAPAQNVVVTTDRERGLRIGRPVLPNYLGLVNYVNNFKREGFTDEHLAGEGSDPFIEAMVPYGDPATLATALNAHMEAGADHIGIQVQVEQGADKLPDYARLAEALGLSR